MKAASDVKSKLTVSSIKEENVCTTCTKIHKTFQVGTEIRTTRQESTQICRKPDTGSKTSEEKSAALLRTSDSADQQKILSLKFQI